MMAIALPSIANESDSNNASKGIFLEYSQYSETSGRHRAPMHINIEAYYNPSAQTIEVVGDEYIGAEVFLYDAEGPLVDYSSSINTVFSVSAPGSYRILIQSPNWYAEGEIQI